MGRSAVVLGIALLALVAACGGGDEPAGTSAEAADLQVSQRFVEEAGLYAEGARSFVAVETAEGEELIEAELEPTAAGHAATIRLDPGRYVLLSWQRPCNGDCDSLDEPTDRCEQAFVIEPATPVQAAIEVRVGDGCRIEFD